MNDSEGKFAILYRDPRLQIERFINIDDSQVRFEELSNTAVENLMLILILEVQKNG